MISLQSFLLLGDIGQIIGVIVFLLFLVLWVIGQIAEANKKAAAQMLGLSRRALYRRLERLDLAVRLALEVDVFTDEINAHSSSSRR